MKKRVLALFLASVMIILSLPFHAAVVSAATNEAAVIAVESTYAVPGSEVDVKIVISENPGIAGAILTLSYDSKLTLTKAVVGDAFGVLDYTAPGALSNPCNFSWDSLSAVSTAVGTILTLTFRVSDEAEPNTTLPISLSYRYGDFYDSDLDSIVVVLENGSVSVINYIPGDVNNDGVVNGKDVTLIRRYNAGGYDVTINEAAADVNDDGVINGKDVTTIRRYIAGGYGVELKPSTPKCSHSMQFFAASEATCTEDGNIAYWYCTNCGRYFADENGDSEITAENITIKAAHSLVHYNYNEPTYTASGNREYWKCSVCEKYFMNEGGTIETTFDSLIIASLTQEESTIIYDLYGTDNYLRNCGVANPNPDKFITSEGHVLKDLVGPAGYTFRGWKNSSGEFVTTVAAGTQSGITVYAQWEETTYTITYNVLQTPVESLIKLTEEYDPYHFTVSKGKPDLPNPEMKNYVFLGWYDNDGNEVKSIPAGTAHDVTLTPYYTSTRYLTKSNTQTDSGFFVSDYENNTIYYVTEIGTIRNIPLANLWESPIMSRAGLDSTVEKTVTVSISETHMEEVAKQIMNATTDSNTWTLAQDWNNTTQVNKEYAEEHEMTQEQATTLARSTTGTLSLTNSHGGKKADSLTAGITTLTYDTKEHKDGDRQELDVGIGGEMGFNVGVPLTNNGAGAKANAHVDGQFEWYDETIEKTGTETTTALTLAHQDEKYWNREVSGSLSSQSSSSTTVSTALSTAISEKYGYGRSYSEGGSNSESQQFTNSSSESLNTASTVTYSNSTVETTTQTFHADGNIEGKYMLVQAGTAHVFAVVGYDIATKTFFTYTYNVMDEEQYQYLDYSPLTSNFDDSQYGVLPFEVPGFVYDYVATMTAYTEGLGFITNTENGTATVVSYTGDSVEVSVPSYVVSNGVAYKVTGISASAFAGKNITAVLLGEFINEIPAGAFQNCAELKYVVGNFTAIGDYAFSGCASLKDFAITTAVTSIGVGAFQNVPSIKVTTDKAEIVAAVSESGAQNITLDISNLETSENLSIAIPAMNRFELLGGNKTYRNFKIESKASETVLKQIKIINDSGIPLDIYSKALTLDTVSAQSNSYILMLHADAAEVSLAHDSNFASTSGNAIVCKNPKFKSVQVNSVIGYVQVSGNIYVCGSITGREYIYLAGDVIPLTEDEFEQYIKGLFTVTFDPNGGAVDIDSKEVFYAGTFGALPVPTRAHYDFDGWFTEAIGGEEVTAETLFSNLEDITLYAHWAAKSYTYDVVYVSVNGTELGSATVTGNYGETVNVTAPERAEYDTPDAQNILWDTEEKTITFLYTPTATEFASAEGSYSDYPIFLYVVTAEYRNRTADSVEVRVVGTISMVQSQADTWSEVIHRMRIYVNGEYKYVDVAGVEAFAKGGGTLGVNRSSTADTGWITISLDSTAQTEVNIPVYLYQCNSYGVELTPYNYSNASFTLNAIIPAF